MFLNEPYASGLLKVDPPHEIYWECSGNPEGLPLLFVHGGPGGHSKPDHRNLFNPKKWRIILFDQRGCGKSTPSGSLSHNQTFELVKDMEALRKHLRIEKWALFGTSWGSTLALTYALSHPNHLLGLMLRGLFLASQEELDWFYTTGARRLYPKEHEEWLQALPKEERLYPLDSYIARIQQRDLQAAKSWARWHLTCLRMDYNPAILEEVLEADTPLDSLLIETHYLKNRYFLPPNWIVERAHTLKMPVSFIHGRFDLVCPLDSAWKLHRLLPQSELLIVQQGAHASSEGEMQEAVIGVQENFLMGRW